MKFAVVSLFVVLIAVILISGCTSTPQDGSGTGDGNTGAQAICGNSIIETGESCDGSGCSGAQVCNDQCLCVAVSPPPIPE